MNGFRDWDDSICPHGIGVHAVCPSCDQGRACIHGTDLMLDCVNCAADATREQLESPSPTAKSAPIVQTLPPSYSSIYDPKTGKWTGTSAAGFRPLCTHKGDKLVFTLGKVEFYGIQGTYRSRFGTFDLVVNCNGGFSSAKRIMVPPGYESLGRYLRQARSTISIPWDDREAPPLDYGFWRELIRLLPSKGKVAFSCIGAHGRTGTALACTLIASTPRLSGAEAIKWVRAQHCEEAIETTGQEEYIIAFGEAERKRAFRANRKLTKGGI